MAMRLATDERKTLEISHKTLGIEAEHHQVCPMHPDYKKLPFISRDVETAKKLLAEAGHADGVLPSAKYWEILGKVPFGFTTWAHRPLGFMAQALAHRTGFHGARPTIRTPGSTRS
jgi:peptide/nickel transport system substrate-binding protein